MQTIAAVLTLAFGLSAAITSGQAVANPKGGRILSSAWYDNSSRNPSNPDRSSEVRRGDQTWEEMQYSGFLYTVKPPHAATQPR